MGDGCAGYQGVLIEGQSASGDGGLPCGIGGCQDFRCTAASCGAGISAGDYKVEYCILICAAVDDFCWSTRFAGGNRAYRDGGGRAGGACCALGAGGTFRADGAFEAGGTFRTDGAFGAGRTFGTGCTVSAVRTGCAARDYKVKNCILIGAGIVDHNWVVRLSGSYCADGYGGGTAFGAGWASGAGGTSWAGWASGAGCAG